MSVEAIRRAYVKASDARDQLLAYQFYNAYAKALHEYRLMKRSMK